MLGGKRWCIFFEGTLSIEVLGLCECSKTGRLSESTPCRIVVGRCPKSASLRPIKDSLQTAILL